MDDPIDDWLITYEQTLADGVAPPSPPDAIRNHPRFADAKATIDRLYATWDAPEPVDWEAPSIRDLAAGRTPKVIGRFAILRELGRGGCGIVYLAFDPELNRDVALKVPRPEMLVSAEMRKRFIREAHAAAKLTHPGIVTIHEIGESGTLAYFAAAYCDGPTLARFLVGRTGISVESAARLVMRLAEAVQHAHERGILHRDIKPSNILLQRTAPGEGLDSFTPLITDFGLAKLIENGSVNPTRSGQVFGTPAYMPPEQAQGRGGAITAASDVYGLGAVLYELLTANPPFSGGTDIDILRQVIHDEPIRPRRRHAKLPLDLEAICLRCLEKLPAHRYATASELADDLQRFLHGRPTVARPIGSFRQAGKWVRRHKAITALIAFVAVTVGVGFIGIAQHNISLGRMNDQFQSEKDKALARGRELRLAMYADQIRSASRHLGASELGEARRILGGLIPQAGEDDLRDFAWAYLDRQTRCETRRYLGHTGAAYRLAYSPDGKTLAASGRDGTIWLWSLATGEPALVLRGHESEVNGILFTPDGTQLVSASDDATIRYWNLATGECVRTLHGHASHVLELEWSPDRKTLISASRDGTVCGWVDGASEHVWCLKMPSDCDNGVISRDGRFIAMAGTQSGVRWWDLESQKLIHEANTSAPIKRVDFLPGGKDVVVAPFNQPFQSIRSNEEKSLIGSVTDRAARLRVSPDGRYLFAGDMDGRIIVWDLQRKRQAALIPAHTGRVWDIAFAADGSGFVSAGDDGEVKAWGWDRVYEQEALSVEGHLEAAVFIPRRSAVVASGSYAPIVIWDYDRYRSRNGDENRPACHRLQYSPAGHRVIGIEAKTEGLVNLDWPTHHPPTPRPIGHDHALSLAHSPTHSVTAVGTADGRVVLIDEPFGKIRDVVTVPEQSLQNAVAMHPTRPLVALRGVGGTATIWDWSLRRFVATVEGNRRDISVLAFSPDGRLLATGGSDSVIALWDWESGELVRRMTGHRKTVEALMFSPDGKCLASSAGDGIVRVWQVVTGHELLELADPRGALRCLGFDETGGVLAVSRIPTQESRSELFFLRTK